MTRSFPPKGKPASRDWSVHGCTGLARRPQFRLCLQGPPGSGFPISAEVPSMAPVQTDLSLYPIRHPSLWLELSPVNPLHTGAQPKEVSYLLSSRSFHL